MTGTADWKDRAQCARSPLPPDTWDADWPVGHIRRDRTAGQLAGLLICHGCPVARQCAADALQQGTPGTVRAGIPLLSQTRQLSTAAAATLTAIANGVPIIRAIADHGGSLISDTPPRPSRRRTRRG